METIAIIANWNDGLISTGEALQQILCSEASIELRLEGIATITLKLLADEKAEADVRFQQHHNEILEVLNNESLRWEHENK